MQIPEANSFFTFPVIFLFAVAKYDMYIIIACLLALSSASVIIGRIVKRFQKEMASAQATTHLKRLRGWCLLIQVAVYSLLISTWITEQEGWLLLHEFLEAWYFISLALGSLALCALLGFSTGMAEIYWREVRAPGAGLALLRSYEAYRPSSNSARVLRAILVPPPVCVKRVMVLVLFSLVAVFASLWLKAIWVTQHATVATAYMAGGWAAESELEKGEAPKDMVLRRRPVANTDRVPGDLRVEYWESKLGYMHYIVQKGFVEGYNMYVKHARQRGETSGRE
ncbi:MAG: hypothetical protein KF886_25855 [Candidatus Hydrogenedentes bacterium]|nr:hypothetical protein [Candidatus Hydrogenedentota bacterium]